MESWLDEFGVHIRTQDQGDRCWQVEPFIGQREILKFVDDRFGCGCGRLAQSSEPLPTWPLYLPLTESSPTLVVGNRKVDARDA